MSSLLPRVLSTHRGSTCAGGTSIQRRSASDSHQEKACEVHNNTGLKTTHVNLSLVRGETDLRLRSSLSAIAAFVPSPARSTTSHNTAQFLPSHLFYNILFISAIHISSTPPRADYLILDPILQHGGREAHLRLRSSLSAIAARSLAFSVRHAGQCQHPIGCNQEQRQCLKEDNVTGQRINI